MKAVALVYSLAAVLLLTYVSSFGQQTGYTSPGGTQFLLYTPPSYSSGSQTHPLLISLHGVGEIGDDLTRLTVTSGSQMPSKLIYNNVWPASRPFLVLSPQLRATESDPDPEWPADYIDEVVQYVVANWRVDPNRIYVTGLSRGATGAWTYATAFPNKVAAVVPISGVPDVLAACNLKDVPIWAFHGNGDLTVQTAFSVDMVNAINECQPPGQYKPRLDLLEARGHTGWNEVFNGTNGDNVFDWMLKFTKNSTANTSPYAFAGLDRQFLMRSGPLHITGKYFDSDGTITNVLWTQTSGPALTLTNTNNQFLTISNLTPGTFEFELKVTDNNGAQSSDRVVITILSSSALPAVTDLVLVNGSTNVDIGNLTEGQVINTTSMNLTEINIRAVATSSALSVRFSVNADHNTRTVNSTSPYTIMPPTTAPEWEIKTGNYLVCATAYTKGSGTGVQGISQCYKFTVTDGTPASTCAGVGKINREVWQGIAGSNITDIPVNTPPTFVAPLSLFEIPTNVDDNYGTRVRGYVCPPLTGSYTFWMASNDKGELWLSTNDNPANKVKIASVATSSGIRAWTQTAAQQSAPITLQAGVRYYIEALQKESTGSTDNLAVGWRLPNGAYERPIPATRLIPFGATSNPPTVNLTSPTAGQTYTAPATVAFAATASASTGSITKVEFYNGATKVGEDLTSPYAFTWNSVPAGNYTVSAKAIDSNGASATDNANIVVNGPPTINLTTPTAGQTFSAPATVAIAATATAITGTITKVEFYNGATKLGEDLTSPYSFNWNSVPAGNYNVIATAIGSNGLSSSDNANIVVNTSTPPTVNITGPTEGQSYTAPASVVIAATAAATNGTISKVEFFNGATEIGEDLTAPYSFTWNSVPAGNYNLIAKATDSNGLSTSDNVNIVVNGPPTVSITSPTEGQTFGAPASVTIAATATAVTGTITKVEFYNGATKLGEDLTSPYSFNWTSVAAGNYNVIATAIGSNGLSASDNVNIVVNSSAPPTVNITGPTEGQTFTAPASVVISATASATTGTISKVEFFNGATEIGEDLTAPYSFTWNSVAAGNYNLIAKATDSNGSSASASVNIIVNPNSQSCTASGTIQREFWANITGTAISSIPVNSPPTSTSILTLFEGPTNVAENYGSRIRGYLCVPATGNYSFWIASNDNSELWLSTDDNPANKVKIASVTGYCSPRQWDKYPSQKSVLIPLTAGQRYYVEALHKEATGSDNLSVGWQLPNATFERPIPGARLIPFGPSPPTVNITSPTPGQVFPDPASIVINANASASSGTISIVEFYNNTTKIGEDLTAPYSFTWNSVPSGNYTLVAKATDSGGLSSSASVSVVVSNGTQNCTATGTIQREFWANITGTAITSIPVNTAPTSVSNLTIFEGPTNVAENYGTRIRGYLCVPTTGSYTFWISSNDNSELWLSTDDNPANKVKIASVTGYCSPRQWDKYPSQRSVPISLVAGQRYYIEALQKEATGSDNLSVGWQLPNSTFERPIPGSRLSPFVTTPAGDLAYEVEDPAVVLSEEISDVNIYPNPLDKTEFTIHLNGVQHTSQESVAQVEIATTTGSRIFNQGFDCSFCDQIEVRLRSNLSAGVYMVYVDVGGKRFMKRLVVL